MCQECSVLQSAHRYKIQIFLHLTARKNRRDGVSEPVARDLDAALSEAASGINDAWQRLVEHQSGHLRDAKLVKPGLSAHSAQI